MKQTITITTFVDDLDGSEAEGSVTFSLDGRAYEIDLCEANAEKLREQLAPYIIAGRRLGLVVAPVARTGGSQSPVKADREQLAAIREWARKRGHDVKNRGRIPKPILDAYHAEH